MNKEYWFGYKEVKCACCGKRILIASLPDYVYKQNTDYYCSWSCLQKSRINKKRINYVTSERQM